MILDTCALLSWTLFPDKLSDRARRAIDGYPGRLTISSASIWEVGVKAQKGRLPLGMPTHYWYASLDRLDLHVEPVDALLWIDSTELDWANPDPVDRLVVALSRRRGFPLLTSDRSILAFHPNAIW